MESKSASEKSSGNLKLPQIVLKKELHSLIGTVKKIQPVTTYEEVLDGLKIYISTKKLFDPSNPFKIYCKDDELGSVVGAKEFTIFDVKLILQKLVFPIKTSSKDSQDSGPSHLCSDSSPKRKFNAQDSGPSHSSSDSSSKRKYNENVDSIEKKICSESRSIQPSSPMILHIPPSPIKYDSSSESTYSVQGYETAYVKDTSDDWSTESNEYLSCNDSILAIEQTYNVEYQVETDSSSSDSCDSDSDSDSDDSEINFLDVEALDAKILTVVCRTDSDIEFFADDSSEADSEIPKSDHWQCQKCNFFNDPTMRKCSRCWHERLEWLPDSSKPSRKKKRQRKSKKALDAVKHQVSDEINAPVASSSSQEIPSSSQEDMKSAFKLCIICCSKAASASIIHGKSAHLISCYTCARKLQKKKKKCPICRRTIDRVVDNIV